MGDGELVLDPPVAEQAGERVRVVPPNPGHEDVNLVVGTGVRSDPDDERHRSAPTPREDEGPGTLVRVQHGREGKVEVRKSGLAAERKGRQAKDAAIGMLSSSRSGPEKEGRIIILFQFAISILRDREILVPTGANPPN